MQIYELSNSYPRPKDLRESYSFLQERTQYFMGGDRCFGHLPVVGCLPGEDVCRILSQGN